MRESQFEANLGKVCETPLQAISGHSDVCLSPQLCGRQRSRGFQFQTSLGKKVFKTPSQQKNLGVAACACRPSYTGG
jgi:hypothetical protein